MAPTSALAVSCSTTRALSDKLFAQLDFDGSGGISFKEFLIGLEKMVMEEYGEEGDEVRWCVHSKCRTKLSCSGGKN